MSILMATKCWEGDYAKFLEDAFKHKWKPLNFEFEEKWLMLNNGVPKQTQKEYLKYADKAIDVKFYIPYVLSFFGLKKKDFKGGFWYSIAELTCIFLAEYFDYLFWIQGDCILKKPFRYLPNKFIQKGIKILKTNPHISVVSPESEVNTWHDDSGLDQFFSDQCFLIRIKEFRQKIYNYKTPKLNEFPSHGGDSFERLCARYLRNNNKYRRILNESYLIHEAY